MPNEGKLRSLICIDDRSYRFELFLIEKVDEAFAYNRVEVFLALYYCVLNVDKLEEWGISDSILIEEMDELLRLFVVYNH